MVIISASAASKHLDQLIDDAAREHLPVIVTGAINNAVLISIEDWAALQETLYLLSIPGMRESIRAEMTKSLEQHHRTQ